MIKKVLIFGLLLSAFVFVACTSDNGGTTNKEDGFDRTLLTNAWVNDLWSPAINDLKSKLDALEISIGNFTTTPNQVSLEDVRVKWLSAYKIWQHVHIFVYDVVNEDGFTNYSDDMNSYPVDANQVNANIKSTTAIPFQFDRHDDAQGFPTIDYLINGLGTDNEIISKFQNRDYKEYLSTLINRMIELTQYQINSINSINLNATSNEANSYFSTQINDILQFIERAYREDKIAFPSGTRQRKRTQKQIDEGVVFLPNQEAVEARFSPENSKALYIEAYQAINNVFYGKKYVDGTSTTGIQDYITFLGTTIMVDGKDIPLDDYINTLFENIETANENLGANFYTQTADYNANFDAAFDAIQEFIEAFKGNTLSAFNITIDFADNDGD